MPPFTSSSWTFLQGSQLVLHVFYKKKKITHENFEKPRQGQPPCTEEESLECLQNIKFQALAAS